MFIARIQSDCLEMLPMILERVIKSISNFTQDTINRKDTKLKKEDHLNYLKSCSKYLKMSKPFLPIEDILERLDVHHKTQQSIRQQTVFRWWINE